VVTETMGLDEEVLRDEVDRPTAARVARLSADEEQRARFPRTWAAVEAAMRALRLPPLERPCK
jgi:hypothetical protein